MPYFLITSEPLPGRRGRPNYRDTCHNIVSTGPGDPAGNPDFEREDRPRG